MLSDVQPQTSEVTQLDLMDDIYFCLSLNAQSLAKMICVDVLTVDLLRETEAHRR